jgi:hypothetical protein
MILSTAQAQWLERRAKPCHCGGRITMHQRLNDEAKTLLSYGEADLRCSLCGSDDFDIERTWSELRRAGYAIPGIIEQRLQEKEEKMALVKRPEQEQEVRLALALRSDAHPTDLAKFSGEISPIEVQKAMALVGFGFDANLHLQLYQGRVIIRKEGAEWWIAGGPERDPTFAGYETHPVATADREAYGLGPDEIGCIAEGYRWRGNTRYKVADAFGKASTRPYTYRAPRNVSREEWNQMTPAQRSELQRARDEARSHPDYGRNPIEATNPWAMAQKRALVQLAPKMHPLGVQLLTEADVYEAQPEREAPSEARTAAAVVAGPETREAPASRPAETSEMAPDGSGPLGPGEYVDEHGEIRVRQGRLGEP